LPQTHREFPVHIKEISVPLKQLLCGHAIVKCVYQHTWE